MNPPHALGFVMLAVGATALSVADADAQARVGDGLKLMEPVRAILDALNRTTSSRSTKGVMATSRRTSFA